MALDLVGGTLFTLLYDGVKQAMVKTTKFKSLLADLKSTLDSLQPRIIQEIAEHKTQLGLPNDQVADLQRQMEQGVELLRNFSEFRMWNYCCVGDCTDQLTQLDRALRNLLEKLRLQETRDVKETLLLSRQNRIKLDEVNRRLIEIQELLTQQQKAQDVTETTDSGNNTETAPPGTDVSGMQQQAVLDGGEALEAVFGMLFKAVLKVEDKAVISKGPLGDLKSTLNSLKPLVEGIAQKYNVLVCPQEELENFRKQMEKGVELVLKCAKVQPWAGSKKSTYTDELVEVDKFLQRQLSILKMQVARDVRNTSVSIRNIQAAIDQFEESGMLHKQIQNTAKPLIPTVGLDVLNVQGTRGVEETMISIRNTEAGVEEIKGSGKPQYHLETKGMSGKESKNIDSYTSTGASLFSEAAKSTPSRSVDDQSTDDQIMEIPNLKVFSFEELRTATRNFRPDVVIGETSFGNVFKGWVDEKTLASSKPGTGTMVAIKKLKAEGFLGLNKWQSEVRFWGSVSHPNIIKLLGYSWREDELFLVNEFMPKGSLDNHLFRLGNPITEPLSWDLRIKIAVGAARALAFLHSLEEQVIYRDFKASNILLDMDYTAKITNFGMAKLGPIDDSYVSTSIVATYGYVAPEFIEAGHWNVKSDVYVFGVVLLEILTGRRALDKTRPKEQHNLVDWAKPSLHNKRRLKTIMDLMMEGQYSINAAHKTAQLVLKCLAPDPKSRSSMKKVVEELEHIQALKVKPMQTKLATTSRSPLHGTK